MTDDEANAILADASKAILGDLTWVQEGAWVKFRADITSSNGAPIRATGSFNVRAAKISFSILHPEVGRLYGLDLGAAHARAGRIEIDGTHKNKWTEADPNHAYIPADITATGSDPLVAWQEFCAEAKITHEGRLRPPPPFQDDFTEW